MSMKYGDEEYLNGGTMSSFYTSVMIVYYSNIFGLEIEFRTVVNGH